MPRPQLLDLILLSAMLSVGLLTASRADEGVEYFENHIRPVLVESCYECHSAERGDVESELALDNRMSLLRGGKSGPVVVPGKPEESRLLAVLRHDDATLQMPPSGKLPEEIIARFEQWIAMGAPDPRDGAALDVDSIADRAATHWAFIPPQRPDVPPDPTGWSRQSLDRLVLHKLASVGLQPVGEADRRVLIRRLYFDLVGLPPSYDAVEAFAADDSPEAYARIVDQLIESPQFGERWARHWLDVARFGDTKGYMFQEGRDYPHAYKYRDWVIAAINDDLPIDDFLAYQVAADQIAGEDDRTTHLAATGYITLGRRFLNNQHDIFADRIDVVSRGMMGVTVGCARCHDHKYDPFSIDDYYALYGVFASSQEDQSGDLPPHLIDKPSPVDVGVFLRGAAHNRGPIVTRGVPEFFDDNRGSVASGSGRRELAQTIVNEANPLTARVFVNRVWGHLHGKPLVATPSDFGLRCDPPPHQALLDSLATDFVDHGWSLKWLIREIVSSSTYRLASTPGDELLAADPENLLLGRANRRRRDFEALRDGLLKVSGQLDNRVGGESERIDTPHGGTRRTLYAFIDRQNLPGVFRTFDFAGPDEHCPQRPNTLVPQQALFLLNGTMVQQLSETIAGNLSGEHDRDKLVALYRRILQRDPTDEELTLAMAFVSRGDAQLVAASPWSFGFGDADSLAAGSSLRFVDFETFTDRGWHYDSELPHQEFGYALLNARGGHPGRAVAQSVVRRWTSPTEGRLQISGTLRRPETKGDGVDAVVTHSAQGVIGEWQLPSGKIATEIETLHVAAGDQIDFIVSCAGNDAYDSFNWPVTVVLETPTGRQTWNSETDFHGPQPAPLGVWAQLTQVLLASNEFFYVD